MVAFCATAVYGVYWLRARGGTKPMELVSFLPTNNAVVVYIDMDAIRRSGIMRMVAGSKAAEELEYEQFVGQTLFDYRQDLDAVAAAFKDDQMFLVARGRFHWKNLMDYVVRQGGTCHNSFCTVDSSRPHRRISFYPLKSDLIAMGVSQDETAAYQVTRKSGNLALAAPDQPVWIVVPAVTLKNTESLPAGTKAYASALRNAEEIVFSVGPQKDRLDLALKVTCKDDVTASALFVDLENTTNTLRKWIAREKQQPNPGDLSGVLTAGTFRREDRRVFGQWPIPRAFVDALAGGSY
jgi:hypothetical protein